MYPLEIRLANPRECPLIPIKFVVYVTDTLRKMASLGTSFSSLKKIFTSDEVLAFLTSKNENRSDLGGKSELLDTSTPCHSIRGLQIHPQSHPQTVEQDESITEAPMDVLVRKEVEESEDGTSGPNESQMTNEEVSILHHQPDESNNAPITSSDSESECSDRAGFYDPPDSAEEITSSSSEGSGDSDSDVSSESACEEQTATFSSTRGRGRGRGRGQKRRHGRGRGHVVDRSRGNQVVSSSTPSQVQLLNASIDISIVDDWFIRPPPFNPSRTPGLHLPPNTDLLAISLFELIF